jgi:hypothetical protein
MKSHKIIMQLKRTKYQQKILQRQKTLNRLRNSHKKTVQLKSMKPHEDVSQRPKNVHENPVRKSHSENMQHNPWSQTTYVVTMGHGSTLNLPRSSFFNITSLPSLHHIITTNLNPRWNPPITIATSSRRVK